jgi:hypothetical protein
MLPLVISSGAGSELYRGLGAAVLGGLSVSTIFTLLLVPIVFSLWLDLQAGVSSLLRKPWKYNGQNGNNGHFGPEQLPEESKVTTSQEMP